MSLTVADEAGPLPRSGQFYMLQTAVRWGGGVDGRPYLPRALSFARATRDSHGSTLEFLFEDVGPGTQRLTEVAIGEELLLSGPFGNGFEQTEGRRPLLVAGGIGLAPIVALADEFRASNAAAPPALVGMRSAVGGKAAEHYGIEFALATEDGSAGHEGYVTDLLAPLLEDEEAAASTVFACGPPAMLEAVRGLCGERSVPAQLAMEATMACGFGACYGCVVETTEGYVRLCVDGPVVHGDRLESALDAGERR